MRKSTFILILLLSIFNNVELKENILLKMKEEVAEEEPILKTNLSILRNEASKVARNLFGISWDFSKTLFDQQIVIHLGNPTIYAKLTSKCNLSKGSNDAFFQIKGGVVVNEQGTKVNLSQSSINYAGKFLNLNFNTMTATLTKKLKGATTDGTISFSFSGNQVQISVTITKTKSFSGLECDGTVTFIIKPGVIRPKPGVTPAPAFNAQAIESAAKTVATGGIIAVGAVILFKLLKGVAGFVAGGPVGALIGVAT